MPTEVKMFESEGTRGHVLRINELRVLADAMAVRRGLVSLKTAVDDAFAI